MLWHLLVFCIINSITIVWSDFATDITKEVNLDVNGVIAAYGDFDSDQNTDVFVITNKGKNLEIFSWHVKDQKFNKFSSAKINLLESSDELIVGVALADFDGNGCMDVLVTTSKAADGTKHVYVQLYYGDSKILREADGSTPIIMLDQPTVIDVNGDLLPDLFGTDANGYRKYWISVPQNSGQTTSFHESAQSTELTTTLFVPQSNAFVDVTGDVHADLVAKSLTSEGKTIFEVWEQQTGSLNMTLSYSFLLDKTDVVHSGRASFADIDGDKDIDLILPVCLSADCSNSAILVRLAVKESLDKSKWSVLVSNQEEDWQFPVENMEGSTLFPVMIRFGDYSLDGMVDAVAVLQHKSKAGTKFVGYMLNRKCADVMTTHCELSRTLQIAEIVKSEEQPVSVSFLDVYENGGLDLLVTYQNKIDAKEHFTKVFKNSAVLENAFLKVAVLSGLCYKDCLCGKDTTRYGANQIGSMVDMTTTNTEGNIMQRRAVQLSQSNYFALELPYVVFGLGKSPNFVDEFSVGLPKGPQKVDRRRSWSAIIPNAQVIVIPYPKDDPAEWLTKLLVTPSKLLLQTGGVLIGTCLLIAGFILILHIKEKREDEREKRMEAHKFHFDAL